MYFCSSRQTAPFFLFSFSLCGKASTISSRNYSSFGFIVTESVLFQVCLRQRERILRDLYTFSILFLQPSNFVVKSCQITAVRGKISAKPSIPDVGGERRIHGGTAYGSRYGKKAGGMKLIIGICEDEPLIAEKLKRMINECLCEKKQEAEIRIYLSGEELLKEAGQLDAVFLDIWLDGMNGYEAGRRIRLENPDCRILMETGECEHFAEAFEIGALRYIRKPFEKEKIAEALEKVMDSFLGMQKMELYKDRIRFEIEQRKIKYIRAYNGYTEYYVGQDVFRRELSLNEVESELDGRLFYKIHRQYIVNMGEILRRPNGRIYIDGVEFPLARRKRGDFERAYIHYVSRK